ncbi:MAG TPA: MBL fold metallo-hydrolase [Polyangia bacterium]|jgi:glyoxylase-like metal-dependent hydrolase (beta-lactamase superfamily II)|nr:MBL fold metallo-hydrolase [Polyangia bacterium]
MSAPTTPPETPAESAARDVAGLPPAPMVFQVEVGLLQNFCEIIYCPTTRQAAVVDPAWEADRLLREAQTLGVQIKTVLITHTHNDHIEGVAEIVAATGASVVVSPREAAAIRRVAPDTGAMIDAVDRGAIAIGDCGLRVLETTGHTVGGVCYLADGFVVTGDVMFVGGCGRTDFTGGDTAAMWRSLQRLGALPEETKVFPGHNYGQTPTSTIAHELRTNPYLLCQTFEDFRALRERPRR